MEMDGWMDGKPMERNCRQDHPPPPADITPLATVAYEKRGVSY
jgi:hypothetical protein